MVIAQLQTRRLRYRTVMPNSWRQSQCLVCLAIRGRVLLVGCRTINFDRVSEKYSSTIGDDMVRDESSRNWPSGGFEQVVVASGV